MMRRGSKRGRRVHVLLLLPLLLLLEELLLLLLLLLLLEVLRTAPPAIAQHPHTLTRPVQDARVKWCVVVCHKTVPYSPLSALLHTKTPCLDVQGTLGSLLTSSPRPPTPSHPPSYPTHSSAPSSARHRSMVKLGYRPIAVV